MERSSQSQWTSAEVARLLALVESERRFYQEILSVLPFPLVVLAADRSIISSNAAFRALFGIRRDAVSGKTITDFLGVSAGTLSDQIRDLYAHGLPGRDFVLEARGQTFLASLAPIREGDGETNQTLLILHNQSSPSALYSEPAEARPTLSRTAEPSVETPKGASQPADALKLAERQQITAARSAALQDLAARLAHDLNNPLMIIAGYAEEMLGGIPADDPHRTDAEQILAATERISNITSQLLEFTRKKAKSPQRVDLAGLLRKMKPQISEVAGSRVDVEIAASGALTALADAEQFQEVILALASSSREDARGRTNLKIACATAILDESSTPSGLKPGRYARVALHDNGKGFDAQRALSIFEGILSRDLIKEKDRGAGFALARAYQIVREWNGDIVYTGETSLATTFLIYLPLAEGLEEPPSSSTTIARKTSSAEKLLTVLVVDDEADIRSLIAKILRREKYMVLEAGNVAEGLAAAAAHRGTVDLLVSDVMLPDRSGRELAELLHEKRPTLKVLYISGYTDDESVRSGARPAGAKFLQKPFTLGALLGKVREALQ